MLERIRKGITTAQIHSAVKICKDVGIIAHASFMVGLPGESKETLIESKEFARSLGILYGYHILTPFPGTTVREDIEKYDIEILTDDWSRYDANSAIVRTSSLSAEEINRFVAEYDEEVHALFEQMLDGYKNGTNSAEENLRVEGHFKTRLVYKILSEDLIESCGTFPEDSSDISSGKSVELLCGRIAEKTAMDADLIDKTIKHFIYSGYLKSRHEVGRIVWYWMRQSGID